MSWAGNHGENEADLNRLFLIAAANRLARENLEVSIASDVAADALTPLPKALRDEVLAHERVRCWGAMPGASNRTDWETMEAGDVGLIYTEGRFRYAARVYAKVESVDAATSIWGTDEDDTWGLVYFLDPVERIDVEVAAVGQALDYKPAWWPRRFDYPEEWRQALLREKFGSIEAFVASLGASAPQAFREIDRPLGKPYARAATDVKLAAPRKRAEFDPDLAGRGLNAHGTTQNLFVDHLEALGLEPKSPDDTGIKWDVFWESDGVAYVGEVKSLTTRNEENQLRRALGQVLRYRHLLARLREDVRAVIVAERKPTASSDWLELCLEHGVTITWPERFGEDFPAG